MLSSSDEDEPTELRDGLTPLIDDSHAEQQEALFWLDEGDEDRAMASYENMFRAPVGDPERKNFPVARALVGSQSPRCDVLSAESDIDDVCDALGISLVPFLEERHPLVRHLRLQHGDEALREFSDVDFLSSEQRVAMYARASRLADALMDSSIPEEVLMGYVDEYRDGVMACVGKLHLDMAHETNDNASRCSGSDRSRSQS